MIKYIKGRLRNFPGIKSFFISPSNWIYSAYLTLRFVDEWHRFPAFHINGSVRLKIKKHKTAKLIVLNKLIFEQWLNGDGVTAITLSNGSKCIVENDFTFGNGIKVYVGPNATLMLKGKMHESASGITADAVIMVNKYVEIGTDCIIAWNTFLTDCDWHGIDGKDAVKETIIESHVWIGVGTKILKGVHLRKNSIVTALSVVTSGDYPENILLGGNPAKVLKIGIPDWHREMINKEQIELKS